MNYRAGSRRIAGQFKMESMVTFSEICNNEKIVPPALQTGGKEVEPLDPLTGG
jgi:hypothetical protein